MAKSYFSIIILLICPFTISCISRFFFIYKCNSSSIFYSKSFNWHRRIYQWPSGFASLHIPKFTVQIINEAWHVKGVYDVQIACPAFASTTLINPMVFRRIDLADCLLNNGRIISPGEVITFEYSNILPYPLIVLNLKCV
ncbi:hypothetical protein Pfo_000796 [Paulownia fortunei]|nr:hypothetical protein Pfo_000796 [Paulownia fortunei]